MRNIIYGVCCLYLFFTFSPIHYTSKPIERYSQYVLKIVKTYCKPGHYFNPSHSYIHFGSLPGEIIGLCSVRLNSYEISIDEEYWYNTDESHRYNLIFHEMAHCLLFKPHVDNPNDYMYPVDMDLPESLVEQQFIRDVKEQCK